MAAWTKACVEQTGSQNVYVTSRGKYFWEISRTEHRDGAITGTVRKVVREDPDGTMWAKTAGSFRIGPTGEVSRAPKFLKDAAKKAPPYVTMLPGSGGPGLYL
jgi:hypothetical protein